MSYFSVFDTISKNVELLLAHAYGAGKNERGEAIPFLTTISAIIYILSATLGSASYKDVLHLSTPLVEVVMYVMLASSIIIFSVCLLSYLDDILNFMPEEAFVSEEKERFLLFKGNEDIVVCMMFFIIPALIMVHSFIKYGVIFPGSDSVAGKVNIFLFLSGSFVIVISLMQKFFNYKDAALYLINLILVFCIGAIASTIYRDNQKSSLITDSQYCYWLKDHLSSDYLSLRDRRTCNNISEKDIEFRYIEVGNYE